MSAGGPLLNSQPEPADDITLAWQAGIAETPKGQQAAIMITMLFGKADALQMASALKTIAEQLSSSRLVIPTPGNGIPPQVP